MSGKRKSDSPDRDKDSIEFKTQEAARLSKRTRLGLNVPPRGENKSGSGRGSASASTSASERKSSTPQVKIATSPSSWNRMPTELLAKICSHTASVYGHAEFAKTSVTFRNAAAKKWSWCPNFRITCKVNTHLISRKIIAFAKANAQRKGERDGTGGRSRHGGNPYLTEDEKNEIYQDLTKPKYFKLSLYPPDPISIGEKNILFPMRNAEPIDETTLKYARMLSMLAGVSVKHLQVYVYQLYQGHELDFIKVYDLETDRFTGAAENFVNIILNNFKYGNMQSCKILGMFGVNTPLPIREIMDKKTKKIKKLELSMERMSVVAAVRPQLYLTAPEVLVLQYQALDYGMTTRDFNVLTSNKRIKHLSFKNYGLGFRLTSLSEMTWLETLELAACRFDREIIVDPEHKMFPLELQRLSLEQGEFPGFQNIEIGEFPILQCPNLIMLRLVGYTLYLSPAFLQPLQKLRHLSIISCPLQNLDDGDIIIPKTLISYHQDGHSRLWFNATREKLLSKHSFLDAIIRNGCKLVTLVLENMKKSVEEDFDFSRFTALETLVLNGYYSGAELRDDSDGDSDIEDDEYDYDERKGRREEREKRLFLKAKEKEVKKKFALAIPKNLPTNLEKLVMIEWLISADLVNRIMDNYIGKLPSTINNLQITNHLPNEINLIDLENRLISRATGFDNLDLIRLIRPEHETKSSTLVKSELKHLETLRWSVPVQGAVNPLNSKFFRSADDKVNLTQLQQVFSGLKYLLRNNGEFTKDDSNSLPFPNIFNHSNLY